VAAYDENKIAHETCNFFVLDVGLRGFEVYMKRATHGVRVAQIGLGETFGLPRAIEEANKRQAALDAKA